MKKFLITVALMIATTCAFAQTTQTQSQSTNSVSGSTAGANNAGNAQNINFTQQATVIPTETTSNVVYSGTQTVRNVPSVSGPPLTSSNDTCMGSTTGSANGPGFGVSIGSTWADNNCKMLKNSRELWNMGMKAAALALMCTDASNKAALELTGFECPQTVQAKKTADASKFQVGTSLTADTDKNHSGANMSDPLIAARVNSSNQQ